MLDRQEYERFRVSAIDPATIRAAHVEHTLAQLEPVSAGRLRAEKFAESIEGRPIFLVTLGRGPRCVLLWSQMHGDKPTHTAVLLDLLSYLLRSPAEPLAEEILAHCTLYMLPLLNPDGAERCIRFNAQDIDVNRDARPVGSPAASCRFWPARWARPSKSTRPAGFCFSRISASDCIAWIATSRS